MKKRNKRKKRSSKNSRKNNRHQRQNRNPTTFNPKPMNKKYIIAVGAFIVFIAMAIIISATQKAQADTPNNTPNQSGSSSGNNDNGSVIDNIVDVISGGGDNNNSNANSNTENGNNGGTPPIVIDTSQANLNAFLKTIQYAEGTFREANPYAVTYAYDHVIQNFNDHPAITGEWTGKRLPDRYCTNVGLSPGCKSTAAGAYQIIKPTWNDIKNRQPYLNFDAQGQDEAAIFLLKRRDAYDLVLFGRFEEAIYKTAKEWASLPGSPYGQPTRSMGELRDFYVNQGGTFNGGDVFV